MLELKKLLEDHEKQLHKVQQDQDELTRRNDATTSLSEPKDSCKIPFHAKYERDLDFNDYLAQFEALAVEHGWNTAKRGVMLLGRLKGRALEVAVKGKDLTLEPW